MTDETTQALLPCPFCGGEALRFTLPEDGLGNGGGDVITCTRCQASSHVEFGRKENLVDRWNTRLAHSLPSQADAGEEGFQAEVGRWMLECFGEEIAADRIERADRFLEEALELSQTIPGFTVERARALVEYVFARPVGERGQEVGGVGVTLAALCNTYGLNIADEWQRELARVWTKVETIRAKQASKPTGSALPVAVSSPPTSGEEMRLRTINHEIRDDLIAAAPETVAFEDLIAWLSTVHHFSWTWTANTRCKYVDIRIDTRRGAFAILDRDGNKITLDELRHQHRAALTKGAE